MSLKVERSSYIDGVWNFYRQRFESRPFQLKSAPALWHTNAHPSHRHHSIFVCKAKWSCESQTAYMTGAFGDHLKYPSQHSSLQQKKKRKENTRCFVSFEDFFSWVCLNSCDTLWPHFTPKQRWLTPPLHSHTIWSCALRFLREATIGLCQRRCDEKTLEWCWCYFGVFPASSLVCLYIFHIQLI